MTDEPRNGSYVTWRELGLKVDPIAADVRDLSHKLDEIRLTLAKEQGGDQITSRFMDSRWKLVTVAATVLTSSLVALLFTLAFRGHP